MKPMIKQSLDYTFETTLKHVFNIMISHLLSVLEGLQPYPIIVDSLSSGDLTHLNNGYNLHYKMTKIYMRDMCQSAAFIRGDCLFLCQE